MNKRFWIVISLLFILTTMLPLAAQEQTAMPQPGMSQEIAFAAAKPDEKSDIYLLKIDTGELRNLTHTPEGGNYAPVWSPNGKRLAYTAYIPGTTADSTINILDMDTGAEAVVADNANLDSYPLWSPDGMYLYYVSIAREGYTLNRVKADGTDLTGLFTADTILYPALSPDGTQIAFTSPTGISVLNIVDGTVTMLTDTTARAICCQEDVTPAWSPNGKWIVFRSNRDEPLSEIYVMGTDGNNLRRLTNDGASDLAAYWSPDSRSIIWMSDREQGVYHVYEMDANGENVRRLSGEEGSYFRSTLSPEGTQLAAPLMTAGEQGRDVLDLIIIKMDSRDTQQLTNGEFEYISSIAWRPIPSASGE